MNERVPFGTTLGEYLVDSLKAMAESETVVDIFLNTPPMTKGEQKALDKETKGVRIIAVGEDHVVLGPMRPVVSCFVPFSEILVVRIVQTVSIDNPDTDSISESDPWYIEHNDEEDGGLLPDGEVHFVEAPDFEEAIADTPVVIVILVDSKESPKIDRIMEDLAEEFDDDALFVKVTPTSKVKHELGIEKIPSVVILSGDEIFSQIEGVAGKRDYRRDIEDAIDETGEDDDLDF